LREVEAKGEGKGKFRRKGRKKDLEFEKNTKSTVISLVGSK